LTHDTHGDGTRIAALTAAIARALESPSDIDERIAHVLLLARDLVPYDRCALLRVESAGAHKVVAIPAGDGEHTFAMERRLEELWLMLLGLDGKRRPPRLATSRIALPIVAADAIIGVLLVEQEGDAYLPRHVQLMSAIASQLGGYLSLLRLSHQDVGEDTLSASLVIDEREQPEGGRADQSVPFSCPSCHNDAGFPYRARTKVGSATLLSLGNRCRACGHEWEQDVRTGPGFSFQPGESSAA
jgi:GAF domain-containing protein